jgi:hypothetical protein
MTEGRLKPKRCSFCGALEGKGWRALRTSAYASICIVCATNIVNGYNEEQKERRYAHSFLDRARVLGGLPAVPSAEPRPHYPDWLRRRQADQAFSRWKSCIPHTCGDNPRLPCKGCTFYFDQPDVYRLEQARVLGTNTSEGQGGMSDEI